jgi:hypothetical protein
MSNMEIEALFPFLIAKRPRFRTLLAADSTVYTNDRKRAACTSAGLPLRSMAEAEAVNRSYV